eukprot:12324929-Heterocapsa_arctica.AAC.1
MKQYISHDSSPWRSACRTVRSQGSSVRRLCVRAKNIFRIFCSSKECPALKGLAKIARARTGGSCHRSPAKKMLIPPNSLGACPLRAYG